MVSDTAIGRLVLIGLGVNLASAMPVAATEPPPADDDELALIEFLGEVDASDGAWDGFIDSLPGRPEDPVSPVKPATTGEPAP